MKIVVIFVTLLIYVNSAPFEFNVGGWSGVINSFGRINGVESDNKNEFSLKAEEKIRGLIEKHLEGKRKAKTPASPPAVEPSNPALEPASIPQQAPTDQQAQPSLETIANLDWDKNPEIRDMINDRVPGGVASIQALVKLMQENQK